MVLSDPITLWLKREINKSIVKFGRPAPTAPRVTRHEFQIMMRVIVPLAKPGDPLLYLVENPDQWTLSIALSEFESQFHVQWNLTWPRPCCSCCR